jgi:phosphatidylserine/phosphatidylglycerophosphate/cardiolipin synthase-like enzyme
MIVFVIFLLLVGYYLITGEDPLGVFQPPAATSVPTTVAGQGGAWWTVYFTQPGAQPNRTDVTGTVAEKLIEHVNGAQESIHIASFEFNLTPLAEALIAAYQRGVAVQWVTDDENGIEADAEEDHGQFALLQNAGIEIKDDARSALMHNKFWIFDEQAVWTGSTNVTVNDVFRNNNNVIMIQSPAVAAIYKREFDEMWAGQFGPTSPSTVEQQTTTIDGTPVQIYFAAEDEAISHLVPLIASAQQRIRFMAFSFTHDALGDALLARAEAGVDIQGIFETRGSEVQTSELPRLYCARLSVRQDGNPGTFHHKVFVIDDTIVVTGSLNFSENADNSNDENSIVLNNRDIAALYLQEFDRRWAEAVQPEAAEMNCS